MNNQSSCSFHYITWPPSQIRCKSGHFRHSDGGDKETSLGRSASQISPHKGWLKLKPQEHGAVHLYSFFHQGKCATHLKMVIDRKRMILLIQPIATPILKTGLWAKGSERMSYLSSYSQLVSGTKALARSMMPPSSNISADRSSSDPSSDHLSNSWTPPETAENGHLPTFEQCTFISSHTHHQHESLFFVGKTLL